MSDSQRDGAGQGRRGSSPPGGRSAVPLLGWYVGRPFGVPLFISPSWLLLAAMITVFYADRFVPRGGVPGIAAYLLSFGVAVLVAVSIIAHELAHSVVARLLGLPVRRVTIHFLAGISEMEREPQTPARDYLVAVAGPLTSLLLAGCFVVAAEHTSGALGEYATVGAFTNGAVGVLNLLPGLPLDGGKVLRAALWRLTHNRVRGTELAAYAGRGLAVLLIFTPFLHSRLDRGTGGSTPTLDVVAAGLIAAFMWAGATTELRRERLRRQLPALDAGRLARRACAVPGEISVAEAVRRVRAAGAGALVVVDRDGTPVGLVPEASVVAMPPQRQPWVSVHEIASSLTSGHVLRIGLVGEPLLIAMQAAPASEYLVVAADGGVVGVLVAADVATALKGGQGLAAAGPVRSTP